MKRRRGEFERQIRDLFECRNVRCIVPRNGNRCDDYATYSSQQYKNVLHMQRDGYQCIFLSVFLKEQTTIRMNDETWVRFCHTMNCTV